MKYVDGKRFRRAVVAAAQHVLACQERLNRINVFPVADGDTGTNMAMTLRAVADRAIDMSDRTLASMSASLAESALLGARGNSGAILAQFFQGLAVSFRGKNRVNTTNLVDSMVVAVSHAEQAVLKPVEGTILTVMRDWSEHLKHKRQSISGLDQIMSEGLAAASLALSRTPKQLKVLASAGVVDAGAQGFVNMLEGIVRLIEVGQLDWGANADETELVQTLIDEPNPDQQFRYCTECVVSGTGISLTQIRSEVDALGDSLIVAGSSELIRIHIHSDDPEAVYEIARKFGAVKLTKADDMVAQQQNNFEQKKTPAILTDSSCDVPSDFLIQHRVQVVPVRVSFGSRDYLDRLTITSKEVYRLMATQKYQPKTSQPSPGEFIKAYRLANEHHDQGLVLTISSALSGTYQAGQTAAKHLPDFETRVFDTRSAAPGHGLLLMLAAEFIEAGNDLDEVVRKLTFARAHTTVFASLETVDYAVRGGRVPKIQGLVASLIGRVPILKVDHTGKIRRVAMVNPGETADRKLQKLIRKQVGKKDILRFIVSHANAEQRANRLLSYIAEEFGVVDVPVLDVSPTLGAHVGPGTAAVGVMAYSKAEQPW